MGKGNSEATMVRLWVLAGAMMAAATWLAGCKSAPYREPDLFRTAVFAPLPPAFIAGPVAVALTNTPGFTARVYATGSVPGETAPLTGQLFGRGPKLVFAADPKPDEQEKRPKDAVDPGFSILWDVAENRGWLLSEALQAYAPISSQYRYTALQFTPGSNSSPGDLVATLPSGTSYPARVWAGAGGFPARITGGTNESAMTVVLSRVRLQAPPVELFVIPRGFTAYSSAEALVDELAARQRGFQKKPEPDIPLTPLP
jgi:hypothetical protein